jgi:hypothetical protein
MMSVQERAVDQNRFLQGSRQGGLADSVRTGEEQHAPTPPTFVVSSEIRRFHALALRDASTDHRFRLPTDENRAAAAPRSPLRCPRLASETA